MTIDGANKLLELVALLNQGADHNCEYELIELPKAKTLDSALALYFESIINWKTKKPHRARDWHISLSPMPGATKDALHAVIDEWFFKTHCSPSLGDRREWTRKNVVTFVVDEILDIVGEPTVDEVRTSPPLFYGCTWEDIALSSARGHWLLHFGIDD